MGVWPHVFLWVCTSPVFLSTQRFFYLGKFNRMATQFWTGAEGELATEQNQIPPPGLGGGPVLSGFAPVGIQPFRLLRETAQ